MTNSEILIKACQKAEKNGWPGLLSPNESLLMATYPIIIFNHDFAKAFWISNEKVCPNCYNNHSCEVCRTDGFYIDYWQYHLQQMVLETEPLKYLEKFLE